MEEKTLGKHCGKQGGIAHSEQFHLFIYNVFHANCILNSFNSNISAVVCIFFFFLNLGRYQNAVFGNGF